jgi:aryl-alcohol dehydrogenase-like predicted oxidoreductase
MHSNYTLLDLNSSPVAASSVKQSIAMFALMEFRHLGRSGMLVSEITYGNWVTHGSQIDDAEATACVRAALDHGITTFDTADLYAAGRAESLLGEALKGERREGLEILTKVYWPTGAGRNDRGLSGKHIAESINGSLKRLQTDYVDVYLAHRYDYETPLEETMEAFARVVHSGTAHYIGISEWKAAQIRAACELARELKIQLVMSEPQYSMLWRVIEAEVVPTCEELGIGQVVWSTLAQGVLTGKYLPGRPPPAGSRGTMDGKAAFYISQLMTDEVLSTVQRLQLLAAEAGLTMAQLAVAWVLQNPNVASAIVGASRPEQLADNVKAVGVKLDADLLKEIDGVLDAIVERDPARTDSPARRP